MGAVVFARFSPMFGAGLEILYSQKGSRGVREINSPRLGPMFEKYYLDLNYVEIPLTLHIFKNDRINIGFGASYGRLLNSREEIETDPGMVIHPGLHPFRKEDISGLVGAGISFGEHWLFSLRYQRSLGLIREWYYIPQGLGWGNQFNTNFSLKAYYYFKGRDSNK